MLGTACRIMFNPDLEPALRPLRDIKTFMLWTWAAAAGAVLFGLILRACLLRLWRQHMERKRTTRPAAPDRLIEEDLPQEG
jgi:hypothetical protein